MKKHVSFGGAVIAGVSLLVGPMLLRESVQASQGKKDNRPIVFQAAGPTAASIQSMVQAFRTGLGDPNNGITAGPLDRGRREINWDGGGSATSPAPTPFDGFLITRGARFTTPGSGFVQAPVEGLAATFGNPTYTSIFSAFSPVRLFSPVGRNITDSTFFIPGGGELPATTNGFGAVFSDVDHQDGGDDDRYGDGRGHGRRSATSMVFYGVDGKPLYEADVPASEGDASLSFLGVLFSDARIARVRIKTGNVAPGPNDTTRRDVVMIDDFIYGEPQLILNPWLLHEPEAAEHN
jgi:hypothetical protein